MEDITYRVFEWQGDCKLHFVEDYFSDDPVTPGESITIESDDDISIERIVSEVHYPNPKSIKRPNGTTFCPDPIIIVQTGDI